MAKIGIPKKDGSGQGTRRNAGRGGHTPRKTGLGRKSPKRKGLMADSPKFETKLIFKTDINDPKLIGTYIGFMYGTLALE